MFFGGCFPPLNVCFTCYILGVLPPPPPLPISLDLLLDPFPFAISLDLLLGRVYQSKTATFGPTLYTYVYIRACRHIHKCTHTCTHTDTDACMDGCIHKKLIYNSYIVAVDKLLLKDNCEDEFHLRLQFWMMNSGGHGPALHIMQHDIYQYLEI